MRLSTSPICLMLFALCATSISQAAQPSSKLFPHEKSDLKIDPKIVGGTLDNGLRYVILPNKRPADRVSIRLYVHAGSLMERPEQRGLAHYLEHLAFNGTRNYPPGKLIKYLERLGLGFGGDTNAHTSLNETVYKLELPDNTLKFIEEGFKVFRDYADGMLLLPEEINKERGVILSEMQDRDSVDYRSMLGSWAFHLEGTLMPKRLPIGTAETVKAANKARMSSFYKKWYRPDRMAVVVVGDIDPAQIEPLIGQYFKSMKVPKLPAKDPDLGKIRPSGLKVGVHTDMEAPQTEVSISVLRDEVLLVDSAKQRTDELYRDLANNILAKRLEKIAKKSGASFIEGGAFTYNFMRHFRVALIRAKCKPENWEASLAVIEQELRRALQYGFTKAELFEAKANLLSRYTNAADIADTRKSKQLSGAIVSSLSREYVFTHPKDDLQLVKTALQNIDASALHKVFSTLWADPNRWVYVQGNASIKDHEQTIAKVYRKSFHTKVERPVELKSKAWPYVQFGTSGVSIEEKHIKDLDLWQTTFNNNVRLNFKQTPYESGTVWVVVRINGGQFSLPIKKQALATFANAAFIKGGLEQLSTDELSSTLAGRKVDPSFSVTADSFVFAANTPSRDLELNLQAIAAYITSAGYRTDSLEQIRQAYKLELEGKSRQAQGVAFKELPALLSGNSPYFKETDAKAFDACSYEDLQAWLRGPFAGNYMEISIVGDIEYVKVRNLIAKTLGALPQRAVTPNDYKTQRASIKFPKGKRHAAFKFKSKIPKALGLVAWPIEDLKDINKRRRSSVLSGILRGRMTEKLREESGLVYSPSVFIRIVEDYENASRMIALSLIKPENASELSKRILNIARDMAGSKPVTQDELDRALKPTISFIGTHQRTNPYWLSSVLDASQVKTEKLNWARSFITDYQSITLDEINALAKEYFRVGGIRVEVLPTP